MSSAAKVFCLIALVAVFITGLKIIWQHVPPDGTALKKEFKNAIGMEFVLIPAGKFNMGSGISPEETVRRYVGSIEWYEDEHPRHSVEITNPFYMQKTEVTQGQWKKVMGDNLSYFKNCGDDCPVENVSWNDTQKFIKKLNDMEGADTYRLPTEAEWEYVARAGTTTEFSFGDYSGQLGEYAWYSKNSRGKTHPVGGKKPNSWGLYDMHGNVWEWCEDHWHDNYKGAPGDGSAWVDRDENTNRVMRGGSWDRAAELCRTANRHGVIPDFRSDDFGFRLVRLPGQLGELGQSGRKDA